MPVLTPTPEIDAAFRAAQGLRSCIAELQAIDPALAAQLETKPLLASKSPWGILAAGMLAAASAKFGLGLDETTVSLVAGAGVLLGAYAMRAFARKAATLPFLQPSPRTAPG